MKNMTRHISHNGSFWNENCPACIERDKKREKSLLQAEVNLLKYNSIANEIKPYLLNYHKALREIWEKPISRERDFEILEKYNLVSEWRYNRTGYQWNYDIKQLNDRIK
jgi:hypothetical protein